MLAAPSLGGLVAMLLSGRLKHITSPALVMVTFCGLWALSVIGFSLSTSLILSLWLLFFMGAFDSCVAALRSTIIQKATPDSYRSRVSAFEYIFDNSATQLGNVRAGLIAVAVTPHLAALIGGLSTLILILFAFFLFPAFMKLKQHLPLTNRC